MRVTFRLEKDVARALDVLQRKTGLRREELVHQLLRLGRERLANQPRFLQRTAPLGLRVDVTDVPNALEELEEPEGP